MSLYPCSACSVRPAGQKLASSTWAWNRADGSRAAWRQRLCVGCVAQRVLALPMLESDQDLTCPACGISTEQDMSPIYATVFVPGSGRFDFEWPFCPPCAATYQGYAQVGAEQLEDRRESFGGLGSGPQTDHVPASAAATWESLGIVPRPVR